MASKRKTIIIALISVVVVALAAAWLAVHRLEDLNAARKLAMEGRPTPEQMISLLDYSDTIVLNNTLTQLERSQNDIGRERAAELLLHSNLYTWYCASLYLGAIGDQRSVPYLIRGLDHPAWRSRPKLLGYLKNLTSMDFGEDKPAWIRWWNSQNPNKPFDFEMKIPDHNHRDG